MLSGLRVYIDQEEPESRGADRIFYSRRSDGPYYRWSCDFEPRLWRGARVHSRDFSPRKLSIFSWKTVPTELQKTLIEHYQD